MSILTSEQIAEAFAGWTPAQRASWARKVARSIEQDKSALEATVDATIEQWADDAEDHWVAETDKWPGGPDDPVLNCPLCDAKGCPSCLAERDE